MLYVVTSSPAMAVSAVVGDVIKQYSGLPHQVMGFPQQLPDLQKGEVMLLCGDKGLKLCQEHNLIPKNRTIGSMRNQAIYYKSGAIFLTYDPKYALERDYARMAEMQWDTQLAIRMVRTGTTQPNTGMYEWVDDYYETIMYIQELYKQTGKPVPATCDLETVGLNEYDPDAWIVSISITPCEGNSFLMYFTKNDQPAKLFDDDDPRTIVWEQINWMLTTGMISLGGANFKYDSKWIREKWGIQCTNFKFDTMLVGSLLDENRSNSLNTHAKIYTPMGGYDDVFNKKYDKGKMQLVPKHDLVEYAGGDTDAAYRVRQVQRQELTADKKLANFYINLLHPASKAFESMEREGVLIDVDYYLHPHVIWGEDEKGKPKLEKGLRQYLVDTIMEYEQKAIGMMPARLKNKHHGQLSLTRAAVLKDFMFGPLGLNLKPQMVTAKTQEPSTAHKHLIMFEDVPEAKEFVGYLKEYNSACKTLSTYVDGFMAHLRQDGRFHPTYFLAKAGTDYGDEGGTNTGRTSATDPAVQTIPKHTRWAKLLRRGYIAPPGYVVLNRDYSQGELRIAACIANEKTMIQAYLDGLDLHMITGGRLNGYSMDDMLLMKAAMEAGDEDAKKMFKYIRQGGKAGNFGLLYGMGANGFRVYAKTTYGVDITEAQAAMQRDAFFALYPGLVQWHKDSKAFAHKYGHVRSPLGRVRHLPMIHSPDNMVRSSSERHSINSPVQGTLSDLGMLSMAEFQAMYGDPKEARFMLFTHDACTSYVKEDKLDIWNGRIKDVMENLPLEDKFGWRPQLQFVTDGEVGLNLADMEEGY